MFGANYNHLFIVSVGNHASTSSLIMPEGSQGYIVFILLIYFVALYFNVFIYSVVDFILFLSVKRHTVAVVVFCFVFHSVARFDSLSFMQSSV